MADGSVMIAMIGATKGSFGSVGSTCSTSCGAAPTQEHSSDACPSSGKAMAGGLLSARSEERRVGKEGRSRWSPYHLKKKKKRAVRTAISSGNDCVTLLCIT